MTATAFEVVCVGEPQFGEWYAIPACLMDKVLKTDDDIGDILVANSYAIPYSRAPFDFIGLEDVECGVTRYYPARPPIVFTIEMPTIDTLRERVREGEQPALLLIEAYANGLIERQLAEEDDE